MGRLQYRETGTSGKHNDEYGEQVQQPNDCSAKDSNDEQYTRYQGNGAGGEEKTTRYLPGDEDLWGVARPRDTNISPLVHSHSVLAATV